MIQAALTIGQVIATPTALFRVKSIKTIAPKKVGKNAIKLEVTDWSKQVYNVKLGRNAYITIDCFYTAGRSQA